MNSKELLDVIKKSAYNAKSYFTVAL